MVRMSKNVVAILTFANILDQNNDLHKKDNFLIIHTPGSDFFPHGPTSQVCQTYAFLDYHSQEWKMETIIILNRQNLGT